jgi:hypothetical protein
LHCRVLLMLVGGQPRGGGAGRLLRQCHGVLPLSTCEFRGSALGLPIGWIGVLVGVVGGRSQRRRLGRASLGGKWSPCAFLGKRYLVVFVHNLCSF